MNKKEAPLWKWCMHQVIARGEGKLTDEQIQKMNDLNFPWAEYADELRKILECVTEEE